MQDTFRTAPPGMQTLPKESVFHMIWISIVREISRWNFRGPKEKWSRVWRAVIAEFFGTLLFVFHATGMFEFSKNR